MPSFPIVDSHLHIWDPERLPYQWLGDHKTLGRPFLMEDYNAACGTVAIEKMVFVECDIDAGNEVDEVAWVSEIAQTDPRIGAIVAHAPIERSEKIEGVLEALSEYELVRGVRRLIQSEPDVNFCARPEFIAGVRSLERFGWTFDICITHRQMDSAIALIDACPNIQFILDHLGKPNIKDGELTRWSEQITSTAKRDNVVCKLSGAATEADHTHWSREQLKPFMLTALDAFGPDRLVFASDWPVATEAIAYENWVEVVDWVLTDVSPNELKSIYCGTASRIYQL